MNDRFMIYNAVVQVGEDTFKTIIHKVTEGEDGVDIIYYRADSSYVEIRFVGGDRVLVPWGQVLVIKVEEK